MSALGNSRQDNVPPWKREAEEARSGRPLKTKPPFDLEERTARFGEAVIEFCRSIPTGPRTNRLIDQLTGCGTSVGANYTEADNALSKKDFAKIIGTCQKEARETKFFIRMIAKACPDLIDAARARWGEANELHLIFSRIRRTTLGNLSAVG